MQRAFFFNYYYANSLFLVMQMAFHLQTAFSCFYAGCALPCLLVFSDRCPDSPPIMQRAFFFNYYYANSLFLVMQTAFRLQTAFSCFYAGGSLPRLLVFSFLRVRSLRLFLGNVCERLCVSRSLLGSYVHQESI